MQALHPLVTADFTNKSKQPVNKLEIFIECCSYDLCDFYGKNYLIEAHYSSGERQLSYSPVAAEFTAIIDATDGLLHPKNTDSPFYSYLKVGRKIIFHTGFKKDGIDYLWQWFEGIISDVQIDTSSHQIIIKGFDYTQYLTEVKLKSPDNYWGSHLDTVTVADQAGYDMPVGCNGAYIAYLDGVQIYAGDYWIYDEGSNKFFFLPSHIPVANDVPLVIYYYTTQVPENVIADLLVAADLYPTQAAALANMDYTATGADDDIARVRFNTGVSVFYAIQKICERVDYEFFFKYDGTPLFKPIATVGASQFTFGKELISSFNYIENIDEVRNHIVIEGEEYSIYDELYRILDGTEIMYTLDDIDDGVNYKRVPITSITAGLIIVAGLDSGITDRMFIDPAAKTNIEAWRHDVDTTTIEGGSIHTRTIAADRIVANSITAGEIAGETITGDRLVGETITATQIATDAIETIKIKAQAVDAGKIKTGTITALQIAAGTIVADSIDIGNFINFPSDENLVGYWSFDEGSGSNAVDNSGHENDGTLVNMEAGDWIDGIVGKALSFDGVNEKVSIDGILNDINLTTTGVISISLWVKPSGNGTYALGFGVGGSWNNYFLLDINLGHIQFQVRGNGGVSISLIDPTDYSGQWVHVVLRKTNKVIYLYINGEYFGSDDNAALENITCTSADLGWGFSDACAGECLIDEVRIYNQILTAEEIKALYLYPAGNKGSRISGVTIKDGTIVAGSIAANTITAGQIAAGTITATEIATNAITAIKIHSDAIETAKIKAGAVTADEIASNAITTIKINADAVTAVKIDVATLSAIKADMGTLTAGKIAVGSIEINADTERILMGAASAPMTGIGVFIGKDGAAYEFRCGNPAGHAIHWDGTTLKIWKGGSDIDAQEIQEGAARGRVFIGWEGSYAGRLRVDYTQVYYSAHDYNLKYYDQGGGVYLLGFSTGSGGSTGTGESCFPAKTKILMADNSIKNIGDIRVGDYVLTKESETSSKTVEAKVLKVYKHPKTGDFFMINDALKVTPNHRMLINEIWQRVENLKIGDMLLGYDNNKIIVESIKMQNWKVEKVYNLEIEKYRTYFADGFYVHNSKDPGS